MTERKHYDDEDNSPFDRNGILKHGRSVRFR